MRGIFAFNGCIEHQEFIAEKLKKFGVKVAVETGTLHGWTTAFLADHVDEVHTMEVRPEPLEKANELLAGKTNVHIYYGNSTEILPSVLKSIPSDYPVFFYLDAHWQEYWPLFDELKAIGEFIGRRAVIVIDDFKVPGKSYAFDSCKGVKNNIDSIAPYLSVIYKHGYEFEYLGGPEAPAEIVMDESIMDETEKCIYTLWFKNKVKRTTGKVLIYGKH